MPAAERCLRAHHRERHRFSLGELDQLGDRGDRHVEQPVLLGGSGIARRHIDARHARRLRQPPGDGVLPAAAADHQQVHTVKP